MKTIVFFALASLGLITTSEAKPLLVQWATYPAPTTVERFVLYRSVNKGFYQPYAVIWDTAATAYVDTAAAHSRTYCFQLRAITATGVLSAPSNTACGRPVK